MVAAKTAFGVKTFFLRDVPWRMFAANDEVHSNVGCCRLRGYGAEGETGHRDDRAQDHRGNAADAESNANLPHELHLRNQKEPST